MRSERAIAAVHLPTQKTRPDALSPAGLYIWAARAPFGVYCDDQRS